MEIHQIITKEQYRDIQTFYFYRKRHRGVLFALVAFIGISIGVINIVSTGSVSIGAVVFILAPFIAYPLTNVRISDVVSNLYEKDIKEWYITIMPTMIEARTDKNKTGLKLPSAMWMRAYELKSVILLYFNTNQFITISKNELSPEKLMEVKGIIYDVLGRKFHLKKAK